MPRAMYGGVADTTQGCDHLKFTPRPESVVLALRDYIRNGAYKWPPNTVYREAPQNTLANEAVYHVSVMEVMQEVGPELGYETAYGQFIKYIESE